MEFTKEMYDSLLAITDNLNKKIDLVQKAQTTYQENSIKLSEFHTILSNNLNSRIEDLNNIQDSAAKILEGLLNDIKRLDAAFIEISNILADGLPKTREALVDGMKKMGELYTQLSKLTNAGFKDYATQIAKISGEPVNEIVHRIKVAADIADTQK